MRNAFFFQNPGLMDSTHSIKVFFITIDTYQRPENFPMLAHTLQLVGYQIVRLPHVVQSKTYPLKLNTIDPIYFVTSHRFDPIQSHVEYDPIHNPLHIRYVLKNTTLILNALAILSFVDLNCPMELIKLKPNYFFKM